jgi:hypothetical protein
VRPESLSGKNEAKEDEMRKVSALKARNWGLRLESRALWIGKARKVDDMTLQRIFSRTGTFNYLTGFSKSYHFSTKRGVFLLLSCHGHYQS